MLLPLLAASLTLQRTVGTAELRRTVELSRGAAIQGDSRAPYFTYWDTEDTTLDSGDPDACRGGEATIIGGQASTILIRFGDLARAVGSGHLKSAALHLTIASGDKSDLTGVSRLLQPWGEGPYQTVNQTIQLLGQQGAPKPGARAIPKMGATWRAREAGFDNGNWQLPGAKGALDAVPVNGVTASISGKDLQVQGLGPTFQWLLDHPSNNCGIALNFSSRIEFNSAQAADGRPRLELELVQGESPALGGRPVLKVESIARKAGGGFVARIKNVSDTPASSFDAVWSMDGRIGSTVNQPKALAPDEELTLSTSEQPKADAADPRSGTVTLDVMPPAGDGIGLTVFSQARTIDFVIDPSVPKQGGPNFNGTRDIEDWIEQHVRVFNETYLAQSHYSCALDGAKERIAVQSVSTNPPDPFVMKGEAQVVVTPELFQGGAFSLPMERAIGRAIGLIDYGPMNVEARSGRIAVAGAVDRGTEDLYPGLMGGGDTRWDGQVPGVMMLPEQVPYTFDDPTTLGEPSGLLALTDVYMLDSRIGKPIDPGLPDAAPKAILLLVQNIRVQPDFLGGASLSFYQTSGGRIADGPPAFTLKVPDSGTIVIPNRDSESIFGKLNPDGSNGLLLVKAELNGVAEWGFIKAWQIVDAYARGIASAGILTLTFDLPGGPLATSEDLASQKFVTDSTGLSPDKLGPLIDGTGKTVVALGEKPGDWVEIDLGRDRTLAEIRLTASAERFWKRFDILLYGTGQRPAEAQVFWRERDWPFARATRSDGPAETASVSYRGAPVQVRFIRIVNRSGGPGELSRISVIPVKVSN